MRMKLSRSRISWFLTVVLSTVLTTSFVVFPAGNASAADTATPLLSSFSISDSQVTPGQQVTFAYVATDDSGSLSQLRLRYTDSIGHSNILTFDSPPLAGSVSITIPATWANGKVTLQEVSLTDPTANGIRYVRGIYAYPTAGATGPRTHTLAFTAGDMTISGSTVDVTVPTLTALSTSGSPTAPGQIISIHYEATDASGSLRQVMLKFHDKYQIDRYVASAGTGTLPLNGAYDQVIPATWPNGTYLLDYAILTDPSGNQGVFRANGTVSLYPAGAQGPTSHAVDLGASTFTVSGSAAAYNPPVLTSIGLTGSPVLPGGTATLSYTAESQSTLSNVAFTYQGPLGTVVYETGPAKLTGALAVTLPSDALPGPYSLLSISLQDSAGNTITYRRDGYMNQSPSGAYGLHTLPLASLDISVAVRPAPPVGAPYLDSATAYSRSALVNWSAAEPADPGVTGYTVTAHPGGRTASTNASARKAEITGLTNDTTYRFTVTANNGAGAGPASSLSSAVTPRMSTHLMGTGDFSGDGRSDLIGVRTDNGASYLYRGNGAGGFGTISALNHPYYDRILFSAGKFDGFGVPNILAVTYDGWLVSEPSDGHGAFGSLFMNRGRLIVGYGWGSMRFVFGPGDFSGDGKPDVMAVRPDGGLYLYRGQSDGYGSVLAGQRIGNGWAGFQTVFSKGDFSGDGKSDVMAISKDGGLYLYRGNGRGGFAAAGQRIGNGWGNFISVVSAGGDFSGDHKTDLLAINDAGSLILYRGNGRGGFAAAGQAIGKGWTVYR